MIIVANTQDNKSGAAPGCLIRGGIRPTCCASPKKKALSGGGVVPKLS